MFSYLANYLIKIYFRWTKNKLVLTQFLGNYKYFKLLFFEGEFTKFEIFPISNLSQIRSKGGGGASNFKFFSNLKKKSQINLGKAIKKIIDFSPFCSIFFRGFPYNFWVISRVKWCPLHGSIKSAPENNRIFLVYAKKS